MSSRYLVLKRIEIKKANSNPAWWVVGPIALTAIAGFIEHINFKASAITGDKVRAGGFAVVHHDAFPKGEMFEKRMAPHQHKIASFINDNDYISTAKNRPVVSMQPVSYSDFTISLVIQYDDDSGAAERAVKEVINSNSFKIAGGDAECKNVFVAKSLEEVESHLKSGFSLVDRKDLIATYLENPLKHKDFMPEFSKAPDVLDAALYYLHPSRRKDFPWLSATSLGFSEISETKNRDGVRENLPHAFVEPLVGLIQLLSIREVGLKFWKWTYPVKNVQVLSQSFN